MRGAGVCWSCSIALAAGWVRGSWATASEDDQVEDSRAQPRRKMLPVYGPRVNGAAQQAMAQKLRSVPISRERATATSDHPKITEAAVLGKGKMGLTRWDKLPEGIVGRKRDATVCPADYQLCPASLNGGCCPSNSICDMSSCLPNTAAPGKACGMASYIPCGLDVGGRLLSFVDFMNSANKLKAAAVHPITCVSPTVANPHPASPQQPPWEPQMELYTPHVPPTSAEGGVSPP